MDTAAVQTGSADYAGGQVTSTTSETRKAVAQNARAIDEADKHVRHSDRPADGHHDWKARTALRGTVRRRHRGESNALASATVAATTTLAPRAELPARTERDGAREAPDHR